MQVSMLERVSTGLSSMSDAEMMRDYQQSRLTIERLENEKKELQHEIRMARQQAGVGNVSAVNLSSGISY